MSQRDVLVKEQFVNSLPTTLQVWIREREPETNDAAFDMADSFVRARECGSSNRIGRSSWKTEGPEMEHSIDKQRCFKCGGHFVGRCYKQVTQTNEQETMNMHMADTSAGSGSKVKCGKPGLARKCPESALFVISRSKDNVLERNVTRRGTVEGTNDTGYRMFQDLGSKRLVDLIVEGTSVNVEAALSDTLLAAVLLGRDVPELNRLLQETRGARRKSLTQEADEAMVVMTQLRARRKPHAEGTENPAQGEQVTVGDSDHEQELWVVGQVGLDDELFVYNWRPEKKRLSRSQKRRKTVPER
ncbi:hypothetical protein EMCRGX_G005015 [Ephydatia muelleri]